MQFELTDYRPKEPFGELYDEYLNMAKDIVKIITNKEYEEDRSEFAYPEKEIESGNGESLLGVAIGAVIGIAGSLYERINDIMIITRQ